MASFDDRKKAFETKFAHDEELRFKANARRARLLGLWAAEKMGIVGEDAQTYARSVVKSDFQEAGDEDVFRKLRKDFDEKCIDESDEEIRRRMADLLIEAAAQIEKEKASG